MHGSNYYLPRPEWGSVVLLDTGSGLMVDAVVGGNADPRGPPVTQTTQRRWRR